MKNFGSVNIVYDISDLIFQNQTVEVSEHKRFNNKFRFWSPPVSSVEENVHSFLCVLHSPVPQLRVKINN